METKRFMKCRPVVCGFEQCAVLTQHVAVLVGGFTRRRLGFGLRAALAGFVVSQLSGGQMTVWSECLVRKAMTVKARPQGVFCISLH
jgi:hypothetical protein